MNNTINKNIYTKMLIFFQFKSITCSSINHPLPYIYTNKIRALIINFMQIKHKYYNYSTGKSLTRIN